MKKTLFALFFIIFLLLISYAYAGKSILLDFNEKDSYIIPMYKGDRVYFEFENDNHTVILDDIKPNRIELDIFLYQNTKFNKHPPQYAFLDVYRDLKIDANKDNVYEFKIKMNDFDSKKAILTFTRINEKKENVIGSNITKNPVIENKEIGTLKLINMRYVIAVIIIIVAIIIFIILLSNYMKNKKEIYY